MPTYEYECTKCGRLFELFQSITEKPKKTIATDCKRCNNKAPVCRRISGGAGVIFRGSGFYTTDYRSEGYKKAAEAEKKSTSDGKAKEGASKKTDEAPKSKPPGAAPAAES